MRTFTQNEPLTEAELDRLGDFLKGCKGGRAMNVEALDAISEDWLFQEMPPQPENIFFMICSAHYGAGGLHLGAAV